jgi:hypothetical protein
MTTYTTIPDSDVDVDSPVTEELVTALRNNPLAIQEGDATAPKLAFQALRYQEFTANGTFNVPSTVNKVKVEVIGGGGGGGKTSGSGGGAGGYASAILTVTPSSSISVTVGAGGIGATGGTEAGTDGGTSSFGSSVSATGGKGSDGSSFPAEGGMGDSSELSILLLRGTFSEGTSGGGGGKGFAGSDGISYSTGAGSSYGDGGQGAATGDAFNGKHGVVRVWY